eukprot:TRINITY_DN5659_c0_g1_i3.p3 TRINITY_DN5659_c0_g1~~TRINITY_DN5659_c0_g1_i3.p3  ORF type:complete len:110 (-),score=16.75 TRINITY_DN5659_c0_g1_i3:304-633(-)
MSLAPTHPDANNKAWRRWPLAATAWASTAAAVFTSRSPCAKAASLAKLARLVVTVPQHTQDILDDDVCLNLTYIASPVGIELTLSIDGKVIYEHTFGGTRALLPPCACV